MRALRTRVARYEVWSRRSSCSRKKRDFVCDVVAGHESHKLVDVMCRHDTAAARIGQRRSG